MYYTYPILYFCKMLPDFPNFSAITLEDKDKYNEFISEYPPFSDISFTNLHIWWNLDGQLAGCLLNQNLVLNYRLPFDIPSSGLGLIGRHSVDESLQIIFDYLRQQNQPVKAVHVPEFTVDQIKERANFDIAEEPDYHEYIMSSAELAVLEGSSHSRTRRKVSRFLREVEGHQLELRKLDLSADSDRQLIFKTIMGWHDKYPSLNDPERLEDQGLHMTLSKSQHLDTQNLCLFIDNKLHGLVLYHLTPDNKHYIINHLKVDYHYPNIFDYMTNQIALEANNHEVPYLNMEMDLGMEGLRQHKMGLRPVKFYKKYTVKPLSG